MIQAIIKKGKVVGEQIPAPNVSHGCLLIKVVNSCISAGTEISGVESSSKSLIRRALEQPENVKKVIDMLRSDGIAKTHAKIKGKLDAGNPTGYSLSGVVLAVGEGVTGFQVGDAVAAAGAGIANHAEYVDVPENLVVKIPQGLDFKQAATVTLGGISMQGVRRADLRLGELCVVLGTGILGLLSIQLLKAAGVRIAAADLDDSRLEIAEKLGAEIVINPGKEDMVTAVTNWSGGYGADAVLFTAATASSDPLSQSFKMCKKKGRVILVGVSGMQIKREDIYKKELDFLISTSYGPGRYETRYEEKGLDYPYHYIRWTENRNMTEYLRLLRDQHIQIDEMKPRTYPIAQVEKAFQSLQTGDDRPLIVLLDYGKWDETKIPAMVNQNRKISVYSGQSSIKDKINVALVGAGGFATGMHLPNLEKLKKEFRLHAVMNRTGHKAKAVAQQYLAAYATTNYNDILNDPDVDLVLIATRHDSHAELTLKALEAGKHVFVEKPLATTEDELNKIADFYQNETQGKPVLFTGFNRRFSKYAREIKKHTDKRINPLFIYYRMNAGFIPMGHWVHEDGGRIIGEGCHIIDLMTFLTGCEVASVSCDTFTPGNDMFSQDDNKSITLKYKDGSIATIHYFAVGAKSCPKEQMDVHFDQKTFILEDYKALTAYGVEIDKLTSTLPQKGQFEELKALHDVLSGREKNWPIALWDMIQTTRITLAL